MVYIYNLQLSIIAKAKSEYESNLALNYAHNNNSKIFQYICSIKRRENFPANMHCNDISATSDLDKAQLFNDYFHSVLLQVHH